MDKITEKTLKEEKTDPILKKEYVIMGLGVLLLLICGFCVIMACCPGLLGYGIKKVEKGTAN